MRGTLLFLLVLFIPTALSAQWSLSLGEARQDVEFDGVVSDADLDDVLMTRFGSVGYERGLWKLAIELEKGSVTGGGRDLFVGHFTDLERTRIELSGSREVGEVLRLLAGVRRDTIEASETFLYALDPEETVVVLDFESMVAEAGIRLQSRPRRARFYIEAIAGAGPAVVRTLLIDDSSSALLLQGEAGVTFSPGTWELTPGVRRDRLSADDVEVGANSIFFEARYRFGR